jgi:hypothetical protein
MLVRCLLDGERSARPVASHRTSIDLQKIHAVGRALTVAPQP